MADRVAHIVGDIDLAASKGLELGPLHNPVVRRSDGDIRYLDHVDTDTLRSRYRTHAGFDIDAIVPIDYASGDRTISETVGEDAPFDYVIASHVIEHVPDLVSWLHDVRSVLVDGGVLSLAIPDHRRCFDVMRSPTIAADVVQAYLDKAIVPSPRHVFDHYSSAVAWKGAIAWGEDAPLDELVRVHSDAEALEQARIAEAGDTYIDVHCWVFTPRSFCRVMAALQRVQLVPFSVESCSESIGGEFFARLRAADPANASVPYVNDDATVGEDDDLLRTDLAAARAALDAANAELTAMRQTKSWRITRPLRALRSRRSQRPATESRVIKR
jgi:hypothetical protein